MSRSEIIIDSILIVLVACLFVSVWRQNREEKERRKRWPAMDFSKVRNEAQVPSTQLNGLPGFSANFDMDTVRPFLERIEPLIESGFGLAQIEHVVQIVKTLAHDQEHTLEFQIRHAGKDSKFQIQVVMGDIKAPDLCFFSPPQLTKQIESEMTRFAKERRI